MCPLGPGSPIAQARHGSAPHIDGIESQELFCHAWSSTWLQNHAKDVIPNVAVDEIDSIFAFLHSFIEFRLHEFEEMPMNYMNINLVLSHHSHLA